jgi:tRNA A-37 threonylcarbamoyl transferase component Bud32/formylglycine-generating enzyme required for sulfatase activity
MASMSSPSDSGRQRPASPIEVAQLVDGVCDEFENLWLAGDRPRIKDYLQETSLPGSTLFVELVQIDLDYRRRRGEQVSIEDYAAEFPEYRGALSDLLIDTETAPLPQSPPRGPMLGRFELIEPPLGQGSFGIVWKAIDTRMRRQVAIKRFRESVLLRNREIFDREARAVAKLDHPNVVKLLEVSQSALSDFIVFEFVDGVTLKQLLAGQQQKGLEPERAARIARQLADGLHHVHQCGIIHRDFKPGNILLEAGDRAKIVDFGLARHTESVSTISSDKGLLGTIPYMSPEQCQGKPVSVASDVYALGVVLYEMLSGRRPFEGSQSDLIALIPKGHAAPPPGPRPLVQICQRAMSVLPEDRYQTAGEIRDDLDSFLAGRRVPTGLRTMRRLARKTVSRRGFLIGGLGAAVASVGGLALMNSPILFADGKISVRLATDPPGARAAFIPLDPKNGGRPQPWRMLPAPGVSPFQIRLDPGDYLVVVWLDDGSQRFHEVYRHVPRDPAVKKGMYAFQQWVQLGNNAIELRDVKIPPADVTAGMVDVPAVQEYSIRVKQDGGGIEQCRIAAFWVDPDEFTVGQYKAVFRERYGALHFPPNADIDRGAEDDEVIRVSYGEAMARAEDAGKRLLNDLEYDWLANGDGRKGDPSASGQDKQDSAAVSQKRPTADQILIGGKAVNGLGSGNAEWVESTQLIQPRLWHFDGLPHRDESDLRVVRGGNSKVVLQSFDLEPSDIGSKHRTLVSQHSVQPGLGFRCARSRKPRLSMADFIETTAINPDIGKKTEGAD